MKKILLMPTLLATTVAPVSFLTTLTSCGKAANITFESNNILYLEDVQNKANEDYVGKITLNEEFKGRYDIPQTNCYYEVKVGDKVIDNYDVDQVGDQNNYYATITIPKDELKDNNHITITAKECPHYLCFEAITKNADVGYEIIGTIDVQIQICEDINTPSPKWVDWDGTAKDLTIGKKLYVKNKTNKLSINDINYLKFKTSQNKMRVSVSGNMMSMLNFGDISANCFSKLYAYMPLYNCVPILPATTLAEYCYNEMFYNNPYLIVVPELPSITLAEGCYYCMFQECDILNQVPELPAMKLVDFCYEFMFDGCHLLESAPDLPATELAQYCYDDMFLDCWSLQFAPKLPATKLANNCYECMFQDCWSLQSAPKLPATTLANSCYFQMFDGCKSLIVAPELSAPELTYQCYFRMFADCGSLHVSDKKGSVKILDCPTIVEQSYPVHQMFDGCLCDFEGDPQPGKTYWYL